MSLVQIGGRPTLASLSLGESGRISSVRGTLGLRRRLYELGLTPGSMVQLVRRAPLGDPLEIETRGYRLSLRAEEAKQVQLGDAAPLALTYTGHPAAVPTRAPPKRIALIGNPNTGKSTVFNAFTGLNVATGNYPGITVSRQVGTLDLGGHPATLLDLPGCYSLHGRSPDEDVAAAELLRLPLLGPLQGDPIDAAIVVIDATAFERSAYLLLQVLEVGIPVVCVLNMMDEAQAKGIIIDVPRLQSLLGVPVVPVVATKRQGFDAVKQALISGRIETWECNQPDAVTQWKIAARDSGRSTGKEQAPLPYADGFSADLALARFAFIDESLAPALQRPRTQARTLTDRIDGVLTHPVWGTITLLALLFVIFNVLFAGSQPLMDGIEAIFTALSEAIVTRLPDHWLSHMLAEGLVQGVGTVLAFLPQILTLLFFMTFLESLGYLSRAAFLIDRLMRLAGLNGKAFVPMLSGYACAVPAILSLRTLESERDRRLTMAVLPLTSCSARLPVYTLVIATIVPAAATWHGLPMNTMLLFSMYVFSAVMAMLAAGVIGRTALRGPAQTMVLELPPYRLPAWRPLALTIWSRAKDFLGTAGTTIVVLSCVMWLLLHFPRHEGSQQQVLEHSYAGQLGHALEPVLEPVGFDWKIGVGLIGAFAAREVFVATMAVIHGAEMQGDDTGSLITAMRADTHPNGQPVYSFRTGLGLLCFMMLACQCMSTLAVIRRETRSWRWPMFVFAYMTALAYGTALLIHVV